MATNLRIQRDKSLEVIQQILREEEQKMKNKTGQNSDRYGNQKTFKVKDKYKYKQSKCYCIPTRFKPNHISKNC